ncbi:MAG: 6-carboxytetrahydropterin synthase [Hyphomicrobiales bacterium]|nr:6-carboxytetrahydropterin synthase [Hyphomicrobiales bacterium]
MFELSKKFRFDAAHTLQRKVDAGPSRRIHGHSYCAEITVRGERDARGMVIDLGLLDRAMADARENLDHHFLDEIADLGPATMENLCVWIWRRLENACPGLCRVTVSRESDGSACAYFGPA